MLNVIQWVVADESYGEKEILRARSSVRRKIDRLAQGQSLSDRPVQDLPVDQEAELREKFKIDPSLKLLPPAPPITPMQDGHNPFPMLDPPVG